MNLYPLYLLSALFLFQLINCEVFLSYKFRSRKAKDFFKNQNKIDDREYICVHMSPKVQLCGKDHLLKPAIADTTAYQKCVRDIKLPEDFRIRVNNMSKKDFSTIHAFEMAYNQRLLDYVENIDGMFTSDPEKETTWEFKMNYLAIPLLLIAAAGVAVFNRKRPEEVVDAYKV